MRFVGCDEHRGLGEYVLAFIRASPDPVDARDLSDLHRLFVAHVPLASVLSAAREALGEDFHDTADRLIDAQLSGRTA